MASPPRTREEERRLNARTLVIASAASASAAAVTSQLWIRGTWIAAAVTPVLVAIVSELLNRPSERLARAITSDRPVLELDDPDEVPSDAPRPDPDAPGPARPAPVRVYRQPVTPSTGPRIAIGVVAATAAIALAVAVVVLTVPELITGQSLGKGDSATTLFSKSRKQRSSDTPETTPAPAQQQTTPAERTTPAPDETTTTPTVTTPTETTPPPAATAPVAPETER
ncbi:MAG TPA: hypothetical protein VFQ12_08970 [Thermoleophilaceae bacterium]|nr:hypothetical protein [Thermoleophilaceae bacterium]